MRIFPIILLLFCVSFSEDFFPLEIDNEWSYDYKKFTGFVLAKSGTLSTKLNTPVKIDSQDVYLIMFYPGEIAGVRKDSLGNIYYGPLLWMKTNPQVGDSWSDIYEGYTYSGQIMAFEKIKVIAGEFSSYRLLRTVSRPPPNAFGSLERMWWVDGIGIIKSETAAYGQGDSISIELIGATIGGRLIAIENIEAQSVERTMGVFPNPFNPTTTIRFQGTAPSQIRIYDLNGHLIRSWSGRGYVTWNGQDLHGREVASATYIVRLKAGDRILTKRLALIR